MPAPRPSPYSIFMSWRRLAFLHWSFDPDLVAPLLPEGLEVDTFDGRAWIGVVPFTMPVIRHRLTPRLPGVGRFHELNVRTYVVPSGPVPPPRLAGTTARGVWFFSLDAASRVAVRVARRAFHLPYFDASMRLDATGPATDEVIRYSSTRTHRGAPRAALDVTYRRDGAWTPTAPGSLEDFLTNRYCLYCVDGRGGVHRGEIDHEPWRLATASIDLRANTMLDPLGLAAEGAPLAHVGGDLDVTGWRLDRI
ncbi:MAG: DUF2071 domain-containing protein [Phycisphaerales bacterium]|nr:DUF2071 domain-containing protein [Phycisphaerales bacterium]